MADQAGDHLLEVEDPLLDGLRRLAEREAVLSARLELRRRRHAQAHALVAGGQRGVADPCHAEARAIRKTLERAKSQALLSYLANREQLHWASDDPASRGRRGLRRWT